MFSIKYFTSVLQPHIQKIGKLTMLKWITYCTEILVSARIFGEIYDNIRFRVGNKTYCFGYGNASRCNFGVQMSFLGLIMSMYSLNSSVFLKYSKLPSIMQFDELELATFRLGLWFITGYTLDNWFKDKFYKKYKTIPGHPKDRLEKIKRMDKMVGAPVRNVYKFSKYVIYATILSVIILSIEKWNDFQEKKNNKNEKKNIF